MEFAEKLKKVMQDLNLKQSQVVAMTGKSKASISQYLSGKQVPTEEAQREIALALGLKGDYFKDELKPSVELGRRLGPIKRLTVEQAANLLDASKTTVSKGLQQGVFPWGYAIKTTEKSWTYIINADSFSRIEGVRV
jgi:hypothetical protein